MFDEGEVSMEDFVQRFMMADAADDVKGFPAGIWAHIGDWFPRRRAPRRRGLLQVPLPTRVSAALPVPSPCPAPSMLSSPCILTVPQGRPRRAVAALRGHAAGAARCLVHALGEGGALLSRLQQCTCTHPCCTTHRDLLDPSLFCAPQQDLPAAVRLIAEFIGVGADDPGGRAADSCCQPK